tara:strand:- start:3992 stop:4186 length:195 start_codon:yes stop_codon:yes gene_type:complete
MNYTLILIAIVAFVIGIVIASMWLEKKGITKDDNDNYIPDVLEDKAKEIKKKAKDIGNIVKKKK